MGKYKSTKHTEQTIQSALYEHYSKLKMQYMLSSVYIYDHTFNRKKKGKREKGDKWEDDFFFLDGFRNKWSLEIKTDRQDWTRSEKKKVKKHELLQEAYETNNSSEYFLPNYLYYVAPTGIIKVDELPPYAGLIEVDDKHKLDFVTDVRQVHDYIDDWEVLSEVLMGRFYNKALADERKYIKYETAYFHADKESVKELKQVHIDYVRAKRLP